MGRIYWTLRIWTKRINSRLKRKMHLLRTVMASLFYNSFMDVYYIGDTALEPLFWFVDHFTRFFGPVFVFGVCVLTASVVVIAYMVGIPYWWHHNVVGLVLLFIIGHWILINVAFHYYMAAVTSPGHPPEGILIPEAVSICKKCIAPKPPRTHHCSICNRCVLKMDHHCPWLNNCIGHYNHRYFFLYCIYMVAGAIFIVYFGFDIFWDHFWKYKSEVHLNATTLANSSAKCEAPPCQKEMGSMQIMLAKLEIIKHNKEFPWENETWYHGVLMYMGLLCLGVLIALGSLTVWHAKLIGKGETSIEAHINNAERAKYKKEGKVYQNPYNFGSRGNWKLFLGLYNGRSWYHILWPSVHPPLGNGLQWKTAHQSNMNMC